MISASGEPKLALVALFAMFTRLKSSLWVEFMPPSCVFHVKSMTLVKLRLLIGWYFRNLLFWRLLGSNSYSTDLIDDLFWVERVSQNVLGARNHGKKFPKLSKTSLGGIVHWGVLRGYQILSEHFSVMKISSATNEMQKWNHGFRLLSSRRRFCTRNLSRGQRF